ncbi:sulfotransferase 1A1-like [Glandiceps talaboti]
MATKAATPPWAKSYYLRPGYLLPVIMNKNSIETKVKDFEIREDDIFIATYPKSGTLWMNEIVEAILHVDDLSHLDTMPAFEKFVLLEFGPTDHPEIVQEGFPQLPSAVDFLVQLSTRRRVSTHLLPEYCPTEFIKKKPKCILVQRNPKDVAVSFTAYHKSVELLETVTFDQFIQEYLRENTEYGSYFEYIKEWSKYKGEPWLLWIRFEDLKLNPHATYTRIAEFLGKSLTSEQVDNILRVTNFKHAKERMDKSEEKEALVGKRETHRKGIVGDWKNWFTVAQSEQFDELYSSRMKGFEDFMYTF